MRVRALIQFKVAIDKQSSMLSADFLDPRAHLRVLEEFRALDSWVNGCMVGEPDTNSGPIRPFRTLEAHEPLIGFCRSFRGARKPLVVDKVEYHIAGFDLAHRSIIVAAVLSPLRGPQRAPKRVIAMLSVWASGDECFLNPVP